MSWLSGGLSSLTDQISNFTKEVLTEGTEEVSDHATELKVAKSKIVELESQTILQRNEIERLKRAIAELEEKAESAELQNSRISSEYRSLLDQKEAELNTLKNAHHDLLGQQKIASFESKPDSFRPQFQYNHATDEDEQQNYDFQSDGMDFGDVISSQHEINRLSQEVRKYRDESEHWKQFATRLQVSQEGEIELFKASSDLNEQAGGLKDQIKELEQRLHRQIDDHQHELSSLQDVHSQKLSSIKKNHKLETDDFEERISELQSIIDCDDNATSGENKISELLKELQKIRNENASLTKKTVDFSHQLKTSTDLVVKLKCDNKALNDEKIELTKDAKETENVLLKLEAELETYRSKLKVVEFEFEKQTSELKICSENLSSVNLTLNRSRESWEEEKLSWIEKYEFLHRESDSFQSKLELVSKERDDMVQQIKHQQDNFGDREVAFDLLNGKLEFLQAENAKILAANSEQENFYPTKIEEKDLRCTVESYESTELDDRRTQQDDQYAEVELLLKTISDQKATIRELEASLQQALASSTLKDIRDVRERMETDLLHNRSNIAQEKANIIEQLVAIDDQKTQQRMQVESLDAERDILLGDTNQLVQEFGNPQQQSVTAEIVEYLETENLLLKQRISDLEKSSSEIDVSTAAVIAHASNVHVRYQSPPPTVPDTSRHSDIDNESILSGVSEMSVSNRKLDENVRVLENQVEKYETEIEHFEMVKSSWNTEKQALEDLLKKLRHKLTTKEESLSVAQAEKGLADVKRKKGRRSKTQGELIEAEIVSDTEHVSDIISDSDFGCDIDELYQQVQHLTDSNALLENERDILKSEKELLLKEMVELRQNNEQLKSSSVIKVKEPSEKLKNELEMIGKMLKEKETAFSDMMSERDGVISSLEELDAQHQAVVDKLLETRDSLMKNNDNLSQQVALLEEHNEKNDTRILDLKSDCSNLRLERENLQKELHKKSLEIDSCHQELAMIDHNEDGKLLAIGDKNTKLQEEIYKLMDDISHSKSETNEIKDEIEDLKQIKSDQELKIQTFLQLLSATQAENDDINNNLNLLRNEYDLLQSEMSKVLVNLRQKSEECEALQIKRNGSHVRVAVLEEVLQLQSADEESKLQPIELQQQSCDNLSESKLSSVQTSRTFESEIEQLKLELNRSLMEFRQQKTYTSDLEASFSKLETDLTIVCAEKQELKIQIDEITVSSKSKQTTQAQQIKELTTMLDVLKSDELKLEEEIHMSEQKLSVNTSHYENYVQELKDTTNFEIDRLMNLNRDFSLKITNHENIVQQLKSDLAECKDLLQSAIEGQQPLTVLLNKRENEISNLKEEKDNISSELALKTHLFHEQEKDVSILYELQKQVEHLKDENIHLKSDIKDFKTNSDCNKVDAKTLDIITDLEGEITTLNETLVDRESKISELDKVISNQHCDISNEMKAQISYLHESLSQRKDETSKLHHEGDKDSSSNRSSYDISNNEINGVYHGDDIDGCNTKVVENSQELKNIINNKDEVIAELNNNNLSLLKLLEDKSLSHGNKSLFEIHKLNEQLRVLQMEKEQMVSVMTEKSRETSNLKAEVHRLMSAISAGKLALEKLQNDNHEINKRRNPNEDMQKEAVKKLAQIIRDKDLEIESLSQKNETLLQVLQDGANGTEGSKIDDLILERENLSKQLTIYQQDREQIIVALNQKHQESLAYHAEVQRLSGVVSVKAEKCDKIEQDYLNLKQQYEDKQQNLLKAQNELINYKHKYQELDSRYKELVSSHDDSSQTIDIGLFDEKCGEINEISQCLKSKEIVISAKDKVIEDKEILISELSKKVENAELRVKNKENEVHSLKKQIEKLNFELKELEIKLVDSNREIELSQKRSSNHNSEISVLKDSHNKLTMLLQEKEFEINTYHEKQSTLTQLLEEKSDSNGNKEDIEKWMKSNEILQQQARIFQQERDQMALALQQKQADITELKTKLEFHTEREQKLTKELDRLRTHLIQIEEGYTQEALEAEDREKTLRNRLAEVENRAESSSSAIQSANQQASQQLESLQQQLHLTIDQRDTALNHLGQREEHLKQYAASLANLQMVLEQFQIEKDNQIASEIEKYVKEFTVQSNENVRLKQKITFLQAKVTESEDALEAASRIMEQLEKNEDVIKALKDEVQLRENAAKQAEEEIHRLNSNSDARVDKAIMKNLFLGYFHTSNDKRVEVLRLIGSVLGFNQVEMQQVGAESGATGGWLPGWLRSSPAPSPMTPTRMISQRSLDHSFSEMFVKFLETESTPKAKIRMPAEDMAKDVQRMHHKHQQKQQTPQQPAFNPFSAPRHAAVPIQLGNSSSHDSHILINNSSISSMVNPLVQAAENIPGSGRSTPSSSTSNILKDVLQKQ